MTCWPDLPARTVPDLPKGVSFESCCQIGLPHHVVAVFFDFSGPNTSDGPNEPSVFQPIYAFKDGKLNRLEGAPWPAAVTDINVSKVFEGSSQNLSQLTPTLSANGPAAMSTDRLLPCSMSI
jgi:hypothetical protein